MADVLNTSAQDEQHIQRVTLDGIDYRVRLTWSPRRAAWFCDILQTDDTPIMQGRRLSPAFSLSSGLSPENRPTGEFYVRGTDQYQQLDLGDGLLLIFYPEDEIPVEVPTSDLVFELQP